MLLSELTSCIISSTFNKCFPIIFSRCRLMGFTATSQIPPKYWGCGGIFCAALTICFAAFLSSLLAPTKLVLFSPSPSSRGKPSNYSDVRFYWKITCQFQWGACIERHTKTAIWVLVVFVPLPLLDLFVMGPVYSIPVSTVSKLFLVEHIRIVVNSVAAGLVLRLP